MINKKQAEKFCKEDISKIENYEKAVADPTQTWVCHHRDGVKILPSGIEVRRSKEELEENGRYYNCPANELIFLTREEHTILHQKGNKYWKGKHHSEESKIKISETNSETMKGNKNRLGRHCSEFGRKFIEHYGKTRFDDIKLYDKENHWYHSHNNKCRWENETK